MSKFKFVTCLCGVAASLTTVIHSANAASLDAQSQKVQIADGTSNTLLMSSDERSLNFTLEGDWSGEFFSDMDGVEGVLEAELQQTADGQLRGLLPYIEQDNLLNFRVAAGDVNGDGTVDIITKAVTADGGELFMRLKGTYVPAVQKVEPVEQKVEPVEQKVAPAMIVGEYEILSVDGRGNLRTEDAGTFGIIAVLIGL